MKPIWAALLAMVLCGIERREVAAPGAGDKSAPPPASGPITPAVQKLIAQLDHDNFQARERATQALKALGRPIMPQLEAALKRAQSSEAHRRLELVLETYRVRLEWHTDRHAFLKRLQGRVRVVSFDDIDTAKKDVVRFAPDRYAQKHGIIITGAGGQNVSRTFGFPADYPPTSAPNVYSPGAPPGAGPIVGGFETTVTFTARGQPAMVAAFGAVFIDADYSHIGPSSLCVFDQRGQRMDEPCIVRGGNASQVFCGVIAVDGAGNLLPIIPCVRLINGCNWPGEDAGEGVTLDDFVFTEPIAPAKE